MTKKSDINDDKAIFKEAMRGVKRLSHSKMTIITKNEQVKRKPIKDQYDDDGGYIFSDYEKLELVSSEDRLQYSRGGLQHKILRNLRTGKYNIEAILDLHGRIIEEAKTSLGQFLASCKLKGIRHVLIIHGKGRGNNKPILKNKLNHWLRQTNDVIAFCSALPKDGGCGALYVLLRR